MTAMVSGAYHARLGPRTDLGGLQMQSIPLSGIQSRLGCVVRVLSGGRLSCLRSLQPVALGQPHGRQELGCDGESAGGRWQGSTRRAVQPSTASSARASLVDGLPGPVRWQSLKESRVKTASSADGRLAIGGQQPGDWRSRARADPRLNSAPACCRWGRPSGWGGVLSPPPTAESALKRSGRRRRPSRDR